MSDKFLPVKGRVIAIAKARCEKAKELALLLKRGSRAFTTFVEMRRDGDYEAVVFDVEVELPQKKTYSIQKSERIAVVFKEADEAMPQVLALRSDFPRVPHLFLLTQEFPRCLCLYAQPYSELKLHWTAAAFVARIRQWLALTAKGKLHQGDQPLEPLFLGFPEEIVLPYDLFAREEGQVPQRLAVRLASSNNGKRFYLAERCASGDLRSSCEGGNFVATAILCPPRVHGVIHRAPETLNDLHDIVKSAGFDLFEALRKSFIGWKTDAAVLDAAFLLIMVFPKMRSKTGPIEVNEFWAFGTIKKVKEVGEAIGAWGLVDGRPGLLLATGKTKTDNDVPLQMLNPHFTLSRSKAAYLNGLDGPFSKRIAAVGLGALGSQIFVNLIRAGVGHWTLIDNDLLLPHNLARHALPSFALGIPKAESLTRMTEGIMAGEKRATAIVCDVLLPGSKKKELIESFAGADLLLDMSASVAVGRNLALMADTQARRASVFLSPAGTDLVILMEDAQRQFRLDALEAQFYRQVACNPELEGHFPLLKDRVRYGRSCRDVTSTLPQSLVALQSGVAAHAVEKLLRCDSPAIVIWRTDPNSMTVKKIEIEPRKVLQTQHGDWSLVTDIEVLANLSKMRRRGIPNETGGVLIGSFDLQHKIAYIVDALPSPRDSEEWPTIYIRGCRDLASSVKGITDKTQGALEYVGEWHSHPRGFSLNPSRDDLIVFSWLTERMGREGSPALMLIVGERGTCGRYLGKIVHEKAEKAR